MANTFIQEAWYVAALGEELGTEMLARTFLGRPVVMYRAADGTPKAILDRCPHRQVPLSKGQKVGDRIRCWYHGLEFDSDGTCVSIPSQSDIPPIANASTFRLVERDGFVWIWMSSSEPNESLIPDWSFCVSDQYAGTLHYRFALSDYRMGIDNFLDTSHVEFVHPNTVTSQAISSAKPVLRVDGDKVSVTRDVTNEKASPLFAGMLGVERINRRQVAQFAPVGNARIVSTTQAVDDPSNDMTTIAVGIFTPATEKTCHLFSGIYRDFKLEDENISAFAKQELENTINEDIEVVEAAQLNWSDDFTIAHLGIDVGGNAARTILSRKVLEESGVDSGAR